MSASIQEAAAGELDRLRSRLFALTKAWPDDFVPEHERQQALALASRIKFIGGVGALSVAFNDAAAMNSACRDRLLNLFQPVNAA